MLAAVMAPSKCAPPELYAQWTWIKELGFRWDDLGGISEDDIRDLVRLINIEREYSALKSRVQHGVKKR